ncbi:AMP-binding enzyme [Desulfotomaculum copahuensis]|uniref:AMP-binding enzyme C-terminal domain-containing protein n=1 Tax=Desulfotomaculum copahuensis TaxID=1838280 RepID=A0A1B7LJQ9_9FIRM|nr:hypothetical protein [Desulfotomaculum copahuensis]OAT86721.1 hypothetical protein A6M21_02580 [Desulfotomaculum copahuensis]
MTASNQSNGGNIVVDHFLFRRIEAALYRNPAVADAAASYVPSENGEQLVVFVVPGKPDLTPEALAGYMAACPDLKPHQLPEQYVLVPAIPRTATGKFQKVELIKHLRGTGG